MNRIIQKDSYSEIQEYIELRINNEQDFINGLYTKKREKILDKIFYLGNVRDLVKNKIYSKIESVNKKIDEEHQNLEFKIKDNQIDKSQYEIQLKNLESTKIANYQKQIQDLENLWSKKEQKWDKFILNKKDKSKVKIAKIEESEKRKQSKLELKKAALIQMQTSIQDKIASEDKDNFSKNEEKIKNHKYYIELQNLEAKAKNKEVGPLTYEDNKNELEVKIDSVIEHFNNENKVYKRETKKVNHKLFFNEKTKSTILDKMKQTASDSKLIFILLIMTIIVGSLNSVFFTKNNWLNIFTSNVDLGCMAIGMGVIILTGGIDLSIGSSFAFSIAVGAKLIVSGVNPFVAMICIIVICMVFSAASGFLISYAKLQPFIVTLVMMLVLRGATFVYLDSQIVTIKNEVFDSITMNKFLGLTISIWVFIVLAIFTFIILRLTKYGRSVYAIGGNPKAATLSGIKTKIILMSVYIFSGFCLGVGGILYLSRVGSATPTTGNSWELDAIAAVVLGGTSLTGGKGGVVKTFIGWLVISILTNALIIIGIDPNIQFIVKGIVILIAILSDNHYDFVKTYKNKIKITYLSMINN